MAMRSSFLFFFLFLFKIFAIQRNTTVLKRPGVCAADDFMGRKSNWVKLENVDTCDNLVAVIEHVKVFSVA
jgi:hypothetical protein